jgi:CIC family chloride channel protein
MLYGMSAGFGAIFMAPLSGAVFGCEIIYRNDFDYSNLLPCIISSGVGFLTRKYLPMIFGQVNPLIQIPAINYYFNWYDLFIFMGIGLACGLIGWVFIKCFFGIDRRFSNWKRPEWQKTTVGGLVVTFLVLGLMIFSSNLSSSITNATLIMGLGWPLVNLVDSNPMIFSLEFLILLLIFKLVATCTTLGSGGSGGIVAPSIVMGALLGSIISAIFAPFLSWEMQRAIIVVSSIAVYASVAHVPLTGMLLGGELYGISFIFPALIASVIGSWFIRKHTIYPSAPIREERMLNPPIT